MKAAKTVFSQHSDPRTICGELAVLFGKPIVAGETLLLLDEIQSCPDAIEKLFDYRRNACRSCRICRNKRFFTLSENLE